MDVSSLIRGVVPKVPMMGKAAVYHTLGFSEYSKYWDLRTELTVRLIRSFIVDGPREPISKTQAMSLKDPGIKGRIWISKVTLSTPEEDSIRQALFSAIESLKAPEDRESWFKEPELEDVEAEWTGYRAGATEKSTDLRIPEAQKYKEMMKEVTSPTTILYFHGGAYYLMDPASHRATCKKLAKLTKGRCLSVRYRLAPQHPFPAALLDALVSYFTLIYPPPGSVHTAVAPEHIVLAGDSAGGNLCLVLLQTLLELRRQKTKITWNGQERDVSLPAGVATCSAWADITHSSPSCEFNKKYDYLPPQSATAHTTSYPPCPIWPASPPRRNLYADDGMLCHPLVSPLAARSWEGSCPMFSGTGEELLSDEEKYVAKKAVTQGVKVVFEEYEAMPHCFAMPLPHLNASRRFYGSWAKFCREAVESPEKIVTAGTRIRAKTLEEEQLDVETLVEFTEEEVLRRMRERAKIVLGEGQADTMAKL